MIRIDKGKVDRYIIYREKRDSKLEDGNEEICAWWGFSD